MSAIILAAVFIGCWALYLACCMLSDIMTDHLAKEVKDLAGD